MAKNLTDTLRDLQSLWYLRSCNHMHDSRGQGGLIAYPWDAIRSDAFAAAAEATFDVTTVEQAATAAEALRHRRYTPRPELEPSSLNTQWWTETVNELADDYLAAVQRWR
ncbi:hypothetical protein AB0I28_32935 [Phytomonospora sp. NPDC050363]|uniref:hypothetical protein n=1 Tax=Phytomonospora sp. NPDC050363 TaxID=3155642 RepID=UPI0033C4ED3A